jgi:hypothetical protein
MDVVVQIFLPGVHVFHSFHIGSSGFDWRQQRNCLQGKEEERLSKIHLLERIGPYHVLAIMFLDSAAVEIAHGSVNMR